MRIEVREVPHKLVLYWLSSDEAADSDLMAKLGGQLCLWRTNNYYPVIFESGKGNLEDHMYLLMKHNYELLAYNKQF